jgi:hypothetical protein
MSQNGNTSPETTASRQRIQLLIEEMPADTLSFVEQLLLLVRRQNFSLEPTVPKEEMKFRYPIVFLPATSLQKWSQLLDEGYEGDALADTESLYDDV